MANVGNQLRSESVFQREERAELGRSIFDLSHDHKLTCKMGQLIPFLTMETHPGDVFNISAEMFVRFEPPYYPVMHRINLKAWWFYVPLRVLWPEWEGFLRDTEERAIYEHPYVDIDLTEWQVIIGEREDLLQYLGFPTPTESEIAAGLVLGGLNDPRINPFPIACYNRIYEDFFKNTILDEHIDIVLNAGDSSNQSWFFEIGDVLKGIKIKHRNWNRDYYTSATPTPQVGTDVLVPLVNFGEIDKFGNEILGGQILGRIDGNDISGASPLGVQTQGANIDGERQLGINNNGPAYIDIQETAATMRQFRTAASMQLWLEKLNRTGTRYSDVMRGFFGTDPLAGVIDFAEYLGTMSSVVNVSDVMSTAETGGVPVGAYSGKLLGMAGSEGIQYRCQEHGIIMGILNIQPRSSYYQGIHRMWTRQDKYDYAWPMFTGVGDQEITNQEFVVDWYSDFGINGSADNLDTWAYIPRYSEWRYQNDIISGQFREDNQYRAWHLARIFDAQNRPALNREFLECIPRDTDVFQIAEDAHECFVHVWNQVRVSRALPKYGIPQR